MTSSAVLTRTATAADLPAIMAIEHAEFPEDAWSEAAMSAELANPLGRYLVATVMQDRTDGATWELVGYAGVRVAGDQADIQTIAVSPGHRRRGIGRSLLLELLAEGRRRGAVTAFLEVRADNLGAQTLYAQLGFVAFTIRHGYYPGGVDAIVMQKDLLRADASSRFVRSATGEPKGAPIVLGIESSCDETGVGIVRGTELLANTIASSMDLHARYGGVVPEVAARAHLEALEPTLRAAVAEAGIALSDIDAVAVTNGPGLAGALMVGVGAAKALALALGRPLYAVNHLVGHVGVDVLTEDPLDYPTIALLVSGGHTSLLLVRDLIDDVELLGETVDDAAGEAFDKVARVLGLPYPGGPEIDRAALGGDPAAIRFPRGFTGRSAAGHEYDFSFSGLKTAVARYVEGCQDRGEPVPVADVAASFREAVADVLVTKALAACRDLGIPRLLLGGGVVANARIRELATERCAEAGIELRIPPLGLCTDNGAMIAALGAQLVMAGRAPSGLGFAADSTLPATVIQS